MIYSGDDLFDHGQPGAIIPSGVYVGPPSRYAAIQVPRINSDALDGYEKVEIQICNPMPNDPPPPVIVQEVKAAEASFFLRSTPKPKIIRLREVTKYAESLAEAAKSIQALPYDGLIVPLRGGVKPAMQIYAMTEMALQPCWLPFTQGANGVNQELIRHYLMEYIKERTKKNPAAFAVIDTADSGHGAFRLANILGSLRDAYRGHEVWTVDFYLFFEQRFAQRSIPPKARLIQAMSAPKLVFRVFAMGVPSLLCEDWEEVLGIKALWKDGKTPKIEHVPSSGRILVQHYDGTICEYESDRLDLFIDQLLAAEASDAIVTDDTLKYQKDVWPKYKAREEPAPSEPRRGSDEGT